MVSLNKPSAGNTDWASDVNTNWTTIETEFNSNSGWKLIETITASSDATIDFTSNIDSTYKAYALLIVDAVPATDNVTPYLRVSDDGGSTWEAGASDYSWATITVNHAGAIGTSGSLSDSEMELIRGGGVANGVGSGTGEAMNLTLFFGDPAGTTVYKHFHWYGGWPSADGSWMAISGSGRHKAAVSIEGVRFLFSSGNVESGIFKLYGIS